LFRIACRVPDYMNCSCQSLWVMLQPISFIRLKLIVPACRPPPNLPADTDFVSAGRFGADLQKLYLHFQLVEPSVFVFNSRNIFSIRSLSIRFPSILIYNITIFQLPLMSNRSFSVQTITLTISPSHHLNSLLRCLPT